MRIRRRTSTRTLGCVLATSLALALGVAATPAGAATPAYQGVDVSVYWNEPAADIAHDLTLARSLGANLVRIDVSWSSLEPTARGQYAGWYLSLLDTAINGAQARGMKVLATLERSPCWASSAPAAVKAGCPASGGTGAYATYPPTRTSDYASAASFIARRYASALAGIEVWNEPNIQGFLTSANPAADYAALVRAAYPAIRAANPRLRVVAGALSESDAAFLKLLYANRIKGYYDAISVHPYSGDSSPLATLPAVFSASAFRQGLLALRNVMLSQGDSTQVWATEFGWNTSAIRNVSFYANGVDESVQASYLAQAIKLLHDPSSGLGFVQGATVYQLRDYNDGYWVDYYGLLHSDFSPKPSFGAVRTAFTAP